MKQERTRTANHPIDAVCVKKGARTANPGRDPERMPAQLLEGLADAVRSARVMPQAG